MSSAYVGLGGNLGPVQANLVAALEALHALPGNRVVRISSLYRTAPVGVLDQPDFLNAAAELETSRTAEAFLDDLLATEARFGRTREVRWGARTVDLDLLLWDGEAFSSPRLEVPHPRLQERGFVLAPLAEVAGSILHPRLGRTISQLLGALGPLAGVQRLEDPAWPGPGHWRT